MRVSKIVGADNGHVVDSRYLPGDNEFPSNVAASILSNLIVYIEAVVRFGGYGSVKIMPILLRWWAWAG